MTTIVVSARVDARDVASLVKAWMEQTGMPPRSTSSLVGDSLATLAQSLEAGNPSLHVETVEEAYEIIQQVGLRAHSTQSRRTLVRGLQQEVTQGFVPRYAAEGQKLANTVQNQYQSFNRPHVSDMERELQVARDAAEMDLQFGQLDPDEVRANLIAEQAKIRQRYAVEQQARIDQAKTANKQMQEYGRQHLDLDNEQPQKARADMTSAERQALEQREAAQLRDGLKGGLPKVIKQAS